jgi:hypothetical protein
MGVRQGVSSDSDEQVGSTSRSTTAQTNTDKDEMEEVVDEEENVEDPDTRMTQETGEQVSSPDPSYLPTCCVRVVKTKVKNKKSLKILFKFRATIHTLCYIDTWKHADIQGWLLDLC